MHHHQAMQDPGPTLDLADLDLPDFVAHCGAKSTFLGNTPTFSGKKRKYRNTKAVLNGSTHLINCSFKIFNDSTNKNQLLTFNLGQCRFTWVLDAAMSWRKWLLTHKNKDYPLAMLVSVLLIRLRRRSSVLLSVLTLGLSTMKQTTLNTFSAHRASMAYIASTFRFHHSSLPSSFHLEGLKMRV